MAASRPLYIWLTSQSNFYTKPIRPPKSCAFHSILDAEVRRWSAMPWEQLVSALRDLRTYEVELDSKTYQVEVEAFHHDGHLCRFERRDVPLVDWRNSSRSSDGFRPNVLRSGGAYAHFRSRGGTYVHILKSIDENCAFVDRH
jgi:hypothetical protein